MEQNIYEMIKDAEMILIGIGEEFSPKYQEAESAANMETENGTAADLLEPYKKSRFYAEVPEDHEVIRAYNRLRELVGAKPYFVVTMNTDDLIYKSNLEQDLIVAPCGSMQKMQCKEHIVEAGEIRDRVLAATKTIRTERTNEAADHISQALNGAENLIVMKEAAQKHAVCPICGEPLSFHTIETEGYLEEGYLPQWTKYTKWLSCTLNRKLCVIELGVGFRFPQVVRFPFEKVAAYNRKASLVRINSKFPQLPEEMSQRGVSVKESPVQFLLNF